MADLGKSLIILGLAVAALGAALVLSGKLPWLGRLPGDIAVKREHFSFYFPLTTCIIISAVLSFIFWLLRK
ncbi:MAG: DUF2905 domain-containing protein [Syntrophobacteraceae bacterium]|nr:DUF2905 domain-containing protein [Syntrophobacteraceae bacterium]